LYAQLTPDLLAIADLADLSRVEMNFYHCVVWIAASVLCLCVAAYLRSYLCLCLSVACH